MLSFSQRIGLKPVKTEIQRESADMALLNELWNVVYSIPAFLKLRKLT